MGRTRSNVIIDRPLLDDYGLDKITTKVRTISVYQGIFNGMDSFAYVQKSGFANRQPREIEVWEHLINGVNVSDNRTPLIFEKPAGCEWCSHCGEWRLKDRFSPDKRNRNGLDTICKYCRAEHKREIYWRSKNNGQLKAA